ncbi:MAG: hypothetical protein ACMUEL_02400 [Flavobacteriales bacterium Tduv]
MFKALGGIGRNRKQKNNLTPTCHRSTQQQRPIRLLMSLDEGTRKRVKK